MQYKIDTPRGQERHVPLTVFYNISFYRKIFFVLYRSLKEGKVGTMKFTDADHTCIVHL